MEWLKYKGLEIKAKRIGELDGIGLYLVYIRRQGKVEEFEFIDYSFSLQDKLEKKDLIFILSCLVGDAIFENKKLQKFQNLGLSKEDLEKIFLEIQEKEGGEC